MQDRKLGPFIDGTFKETSVEYEVLKPCTEQVIAKVGLSTEEDVNAAVNSSLKAADTWANLSGHKRACHICRWVYSVERYWGKIGNVVCIVNIFIFWQIFVIHYHHLSCHSPV